MTYLAQHSLPMKDFLMSIGEVVGVLLAGIFVGAFGMLRKGEWSIVKAMKDRKRFIENHTRIHELLTELRVTIRACRCIIFQFHNGGKFADGTSVKRFSVTHESCGTSIPSMILESQDVLLTRYMEIIQVMDESSGKIIATNTLPPSAFRSGLEINNVEYFSIVPLRCMDGLTPMGFVCCHWCSSDSLDEIEKQGVSQTELEEIVSESSATINTHLLYGHKSK